MIHRIIPLALIAIGGVIALSRLTWAGGGAPPGAIPPAVIPGTPEVPVPSKNAVVQPADLPRPPVIPADLKPAPTIPPVPPESVDQLLEKIVAIQAQRAELEKQEGQLKSLLEKRLAEQQERLKKIGLGPAVGPVVPNFPTAVGSFPPPDLPTFLGSPKK